jgi:hypothetical protein
MMDFGLSFGYVFKDKEWFGKIAIVALCSLIPVVGQLIVVGWGLKATKNVIDGHVENALPKLDFGADLGRGFMAWLITAIYSLPVAFVVGISGALFGFSDGVYEEAIRVILMIVGGCLGFLGLLLAILIGFMGMAAVANYVAKGQFSAAFKLKEVFGLVKKSFVSWLLVLVGGVIAMGIIAPLGVIICFIGALFTSAYATAVYSHLLGQAYNKSATPVLAEVDVL